MLPSVADRFVMTTAIAADNLPAVPPAQFTSRVGLRHLLEPALVQSTLPHIKENLRTFN